MTLLSWEDFLGDTSQCKNELVVSGNLDVIVVASPNDIGKKWIWLGCVCMCVCACVCVEGGGSSVSWLGSVVDIWLC